MNLATIAFNACYGSLTEARCKVRVRGRDVIEEALCAGIELERTNTEAGMHDGATGTVRFLRDNEPAPRIKSGDVIEVKMVHMTRYQSLRVSVRNDIGGAVRCEVVAEFE
jgi:hypothetical protein